MLRDRLSQEIVDRANAITDLGNTLGQQIADEENRATSAENDIIEYINEFADITEENIQTLENTISSVSSDLSLIINDNYDTLADNLEEEINRASNEENLLSSAINAEKNDREEAISALQETITNEIEAKINELSGTVETGFDQLNNVDTELSGHIDNVSAGVTALSNDLHTNYYTNTEVYNKEEVDEAIANFGGFEVHPSTADVVLPKTNIIYLIGPSASTASDLYQEYIYTSGVPSGEFVLIGDTTVDLSNYYQKDDVDGFVSDLNGAIIDEQQARTIEINSLSSEIDENYYTKDEINTFTSNLNDAITAETTRATDTENTISQNLVTSATNLENTITSLSETVDETIESLSGKIDTQFTEVNNNITDLDSKKQDVLSAGDGIDITNDVVSHSIKVIENNDQEDTIEDTIMTVYLKNNHYKVITLDPTVTEIHFWITETDSNVLQETGFEFQVPANSVLTDLEFRVIDNENIKIYTIIPKTYKTPNIYQGTIVNYRCTIGEYKVE